MTTEPTLTPGQAPSIPAAVVTQQPATDAGNNTPVGGLQGNGTVAEPAKSVDPEVQSPLTKQDTPETKPVPVPEKYELKLSEGSLLKPEYVEQVAAFAKSNNLTQAQAQGILARDEVLFRQMQETSIQQHEQQIEQWKQQSFQDPEFGGERLGHHAELAKRALTRFGGDAMMQLIDQTGYGNHPEVIRTFARIGKAMAEDKMSAPGGTIDHQQSPEQILYGKTHNK